MNETQIEKKMPLSQLENRELRVYLFVTRPMDIQIQNEGVNLIFSFDLDKAITKVAEMVPKGFNIKPFGYLLAKDLLNRMETGTSTSLSQTQEKPIKKETTKEQFIYNLKLVIDQFLKGEDKEKLKEIISRIK